MGGVWESCSGPPGGPDADFLVWFPQWVPHHRIFPDPFFFISRPSCPKGAPFPDFSRPLLYILAGLVFQIGLPTDFSRPMFFYKQAFLSQGGPLPVFSQNPFVYIGAKRNFKKTAIRLSTLFSEPCCTTLGVCLWTSQSCKKWIWPPSDKTVGPKKHPLDH